MRNFIVLLFVCAIMSACSPEKRLQRLLRNHPELTTTKADTTSDTLVYVREVYIPGDTIEIHNSDTIIDTEYQTLYVDKYHIKSIVKPDTFLLHDTIIRTKYVTTTITKPCEHPGSFVVPEPVAFLFAVLAGIGLLWLFNNILPKRNDQ